MNDDDIPSAPEKSGGILSGYTAPAFSVDGSGLRMLFNEKDWANFKQSLADGPADAIGGAQNQKVAAAYDGVCRLADGSVHAYIDAGGGYGNIYGGGNPDGSGQAGIGQAANGTAMPTLPKPGGVGGGGPSGKATSPASSAARGLTGGARSGVLRPLTGTGTVGGSIGRTIPFLGVPLMLNDFYQHDTAPDCVPVPDPTVIY